MQPIQYDSFCISVLNAKLFLRNVISTPSANMQETGGLNDGLINYKLVKASPTSLYDKQKIALSRKSHMLQIL